MIVVPPVCCLSWLTFSPGPSPLQTIDGGQESVQSREVAFFAAGGRTRLEAACACAPAAGFFLCLFFLESQRHWSQREERKNGAEKRHGGFITLKHKTTRHNTPITYVRGARRRDASHALKKKKPRKEQRRENGRKRWAPCYGVSFCVVSVCK